MLKHTILAILCLSAAATAAVKEITVTGEFDHGPLPEHFGLQFPVPFTYRLQYDDAPSHDWNSDATLGIYYFYDLPVTLDFADQHIEAIGTEVRVYSGHQGLWGVTFGNRSPLTHAGLDLPEYFGLYGSFISPFDRSTTSDGIEWAALNGTNTISSYVYISGNQTGTENFVRLQANHLTEYTVRDVPEPSAAILSAIAGALLLNRRRSPDTLPPAPRATR